MLTQHEADELLTMPKEVEGRAHSLPAPGGRRTLLARSVQFGPSGRPERFSLDVTRGRRDVSQYSLQIRARNTTVIARVCVNSGAHRNPPDSPSARLRPYEGQLLDEPHLHSYVEGFDDQWAMPLPMSFTHPSDLMATWVQFLSYCNVTTPEGVQGGLL